MDKSSTVNATTAQQWQRLCRLEDLPPEGVHGFDLSGNNTDDIFVIHKEGLLSCFRNSCPHWPGATLPWRKDAYLDRKGQHIMCHGHGALFTIGDGLCISGPCEGQRLQSVPVKVTASGELYIVWKPDSSRS